MEAVKYQREVARTDEAMARVTAYLRCLGLPPESARREAAVALERLAMIANVAIADLASAFDSWLEYLCELLVPRGQVSPRLAMPPATLLAWYVGPLLAKCPEAFLKRDGLPERFLLDVRALTQPPIPEETPAAMPAQPIADVPVIFHRRFWRGLAQWIVSAARWVGAWKGEG